MSRPTKSKITGWFQPSQEKGPRTDANACAQPPKRAASHSSSKDVPDSGAKKFKYQPSWEVEFPWLLYEESSGTMRCRPCGVFPNLAEKGNQFVKGTTHFKKETVRRHSDSKGHKDALLACESKSKAPGDTALGQAFKQAFATWEESDVKDLKVKLNTAYYVATDFGNIMILQHKNGLPVTNSYCNDKQCAEFIQCIANTMKTALKEDLKAARYIAILADGCTDVSVSENEQVHCRYVKDGEPVTRFAAIEAPASADARGVYETGIKKGMEDYPDWKSKMVAFTADGANVNLGSKNGVAALMKADIGPYVTELHCWAHNLELAAQDARKHSQNNILKDVNLLLHQVWHVYHFSPKARRELGIVAGSLNIASFTPVKLAGTRWVPHLTRALDQLLYRALPAVLLHLEHRKADPKSKSEAMGRAGAIIRKLHNKSFLAGCFFVLDVYEGLREMSEYFQRDGITLPAATKKLKEATANLDVMTETPKPNGHYERHIAGLNNTEEASADGLMQLQTSLPCQQASPMWQEMRQCISSRDLLPCLVQRWRRRASL